MAIYYLDVDDEITSAAARIRGSADARIAIVMPSGSRVATSRINFKLLEREAKQRNKQLAIVAPDAQVRSLAQSAFATSPLFSTSTLLVRVVALTPSLTVTATFAAPAPVLDGTVMCQRHIELSSLRLASVLVLASA